MSSDRRLVRSQSSEQSDDRPDLAATLEHYGVDVNTSRSRQMVACPVHDERDPSCSVDLDKQLWRCHACGAGGDAFTLIEQKESVDHQRARAIAADLGLPASGAGRGDGEVRSSRYGRSAPQPKSRGRPYSPSWRRSR